MLVSKPTLSILKCKNKMNLNKVISNKSCQLNDSQDSLQSFFFFFYFYLGFLLRPFTNHGAAGEGGWHFFNSSLPLPPASQTFRHQLGDNCRELTFAHSQQPDSNLKPLVSERKSLSTKLRARYLMRWRQQMP